MRVSIRPVPVRRFMLSGGDQTDNAVGQPQSGFWFGNIDDLWNWGKPSGWGGPWTNTPVAPNVPSDRFLMTGFDRKIVHLMHDADTTVTFTVEVDFLGDGTWLAYRDFEVPTGGYRYHTFPQGFSAHWIRVHSDTGCRATVVFVYT